MQSCATLCGCQSLEQRQVYLSAVQGCATLPFGRRSYSRLMHAMFAGTDSSCGSEHYIALLQLRACCDRAAFHLELVSQVVIMGKRAGSHVMLSPLKLLIGAHADQIVMADIFIFEPVCAAEVLSPHVSLSSHHEMHLIRCIMSSLYAASKTLTFFSLGGALHSCSRWPVSVTGQKRCSNAAAAWQTA